MKLKEPESSEYRLHQEGFSLPNIGMAELIKDVISKGASFRFSASGSSMTPFIKDGDIITISPFSLSSLSLGRIAAFILPGTGKPAIHRIIGKMDKGFLFKGDSSLKADGPVPPDKIIGIVTRLERDKKEVAFSLGPERAIIALLNRRGLLPFVLRLWLLLPCWLRRFIKCRIIL